MERNQKVEDYMRTIYRLRENGLVRGAYIARELGVSKPTVCVALKEMEAAGYLSVQSDRTVELTEKGEKIGKSVIERNRVIFGLLTDLGVDKSIADADACLHFRVLACLGEGGQGDQHIFQDGNGFAVTLHS